MIWKVPPELSKREQEVIQLLGERSRFFVFLRQVRHRLFDLGFEERLDTAYSDQPRGVDPLPAAMLAMVVLLQAYTKVSDDEAVERAKTDLRWQLVLGCLGCTQAPFSKKVLVVFRQRLIGYDLDKDLLTRTEELAKATKLFGATQIAQLRLAIDSAPLEGAGRVEDTLNLIGHATRKLVRLVADALRIGVDEVNAQAGLKWTGGDSVKAALDLDWDKADAQSEGLRRLVADAEQLQQWLAQQTLPDRFGVKVQAIVATLRRVIEQDTEPDPSGPGLRIKKGVAVDRLISLSDPDMRHGRKSRTQRIDGYKRYTATDLDTGLTRAACALPANVPEDQGADKMRADMEQQGTIGEVHVDRAFLPSQLVADVNEAGGTIVAKPYKSTNGALYTKEEFEVDLEHGTVRCPQDQVTPIQGDKASFPASTCAACPARANCQKIGAREGRTISIHPHEALFQELRARTETPEGRQVLRERVKTEHKLAHLCNRQGPQARYRGTRKNDLDVRRTEAVNNLLVIARVEREHEESLAMAA